MAHSVPDGRLDFEIGVIIDDSRMVVARWYVALEGIPSHSADLWWTESLGLQFPQSVAFDGKPGKHEQAGHNHAKTYNEASKGTWILGSISGWTH